MTPEDKSKCKRIINSWSAIDGASNIIPLPGLGVAADITSLSMMARELAGVFGIDKTAAAAKGLVVATLKRVLMKQPIKAVGKELCKLIPFAGQALSASISVAIAEATGWAMAEQFSKSAAA